MPAAVVELRHGLVAQRVLHGDRAVVTDGDYLELGVALPLSESALQVVVGQSEEVVAEQVVGNEFRIGVLKGSVQQKWIVFGPNLKRLLTLTLSKKSCVTLQVFGKKQMSSLLNFLDDRRRPAQHVFSSEYKYPFKLLLMEMLDHGVNLKP